MIGTTLSKYRIVEKLGEGGMGAVYRAEDTRLGRQVALKLLPAAALADREARARMLEEARAIARLEHPNICTLFEFDEADGQPFIAMQLVEGGSLRDALAAGPLAEARVREIVAAIATALEAAHARGIVHRDVKCDNILLSPDGRILLADFGLAFEDRDTRLTAPDISVGTPYAMAPEQVSGETAVPASDQFALGVVAYECLTGARPFQGDTLPALIHAVLNRLAESPSKRRNGIHPGWDAPILRALEKDPAARYASVAAFASAVAATAPKAPTTKPAGTKPRSLAVLYFDNMSSDPESDYFCAGITEDLLTDLSKVGGLGVASRNAVSRYRGQSVDIPRIAADLGVDAVVEGSVRKAGDRVRINAQLIDAATGMHLWADRYDRTLDDVFAVQDDITSSIAKALRGALSEGEASQMLVSRPDDARAYDTYLKGRQHYEAYTPDSMAVALRHFEEATRIDPSYALAWAGIADACGQMVDKGWDKEPAWLERGEKAARRALELAPRLPEAYKALALNLHLSGRREESLRLLEQALELHPTFIHAIANLGSYRFENGDIAGAERALRRANACDPTDTYVGMLLTFLVLSTGRMQEAHEMMDTLDKWSIGHFRAVLEMIRVVVLGELGSFADARRQAERLAPGGNEGVLRALLLQYIAIAEGSSIDVPSLVPANEGWPLRDVTVLAAAAASDADATARALKRYALIEPYSWIVDAGWVRWTRLLSRVQLSPPVQAWLGDRGRSLVWPREAPTLAEDVRAQFSDFTIASGVPGESGIP